MRIMSIENKQLGEMTSGEIVRFEDNKVILKNVVINYDNTDKDSSSNLKELVLNMNEICGDIKIYDK